MTLYILGTGPGHIDHMSRRAVEIIEKVDCIAGYTTYIELIKPLIKKQEIIATGMTREVDRVKQALDMALTGRSCALISGGDAGIYAMAGLVFEICREKKISVERHGGKPLEIPDTQPQHLSIEIVPGIPALAAGAALAGAPLTHDFAVISLSDLLTPWKKIETRLNAAAAADFVIVLYNPKSRKRIWQLEKAKEIVELHRSSKTPVAIVTGAMRENQRIVFSELGHMHKEDIGMQTIIFIGSSASLQYFDFLFTPRGYAQKYTI